MSEFWMHEVALMLFVWFITHHYQYWEVIGLVKKTHPQPQPASGQVEKKAEKAKKEFQGLTVKPVCHGGEHAEEIPVMSRVPPPLINPKKGRPKSVPTGLQFCPKQECDYYGWAGRGNISANGHPNCGRNRQLYCCACKSWFMETTDTLFYRK